MRKRLPFVLAVLVAMLFVYCGNSAMKGGDGGMGMPDAGAQACCTAGQTFTKIAEGKFDSSNKMLVSAVGAYREVILYTNSTQRTNQPGETACALLVRFRPDGSSMFGRTGVQSDDDHIEGGRIRVDGADMELSFNYVPAACAGATVDYVLAGIQ